MSTKQPSIFDDSHTMPISAKEVPWIPRLEASYAAILAEWRRLPQKMMLHWPPANRRFMQAIMLSLNGEVSPFASCCPTLMAFSHTIPGLRSVSLQTMQAGGHLAPHHGATSGVMRVHLGLEVHAGNWIEVHGKRTPFENGKCFAFDDMAVHEVKNESGRPRTNLILDCWAPWNIPGDRIRRMKHRAAHALGMKSSNVEKYFQASKRYAEKYQMENPHDFPAHQASAMQPAYN